jgi:hypothetical protein
MSFTASSPASRTASSGALLRAVLGVDAALSLLTGILHLAAGSGLNDLTQLGMPLITESGLILVAYGAFVAWVARQAHPSDRLVWLLIVVGNLGWAVAGAATLALVPASVTALGKAYLLFNIAYGLVMASLMLAGLRRRSAN